MKREVKKLETNYPHRCGKDFVDRINQRLLRDHVKKHWATAPAQAKQVLEMLETKNPMAPGAGAKTGGLTAAQRKQAIAIGKGMKNNWPKAWVPVDVLADWLFKDQVWRKLCGAGIGGGVGYTKHGLAGPSTNWLFRTPKEDEISKWGDSGAAAYVMECCSVPES